MDELRDEKTAADHYRTAAMHHASALAVRVDKRGETNESAREKYTAHMREAQLHAELTNARIAAVQLLLQDRQYRAEIGEMLPPRQQRVIDAELEAWGDALAPRGSGVPS